MATKAPGKAYRKGLSLVELMDMFPSEDAAREWFESVFWPEGRCCGHCGSTNTKTASHKYMPYWCSDCRSYFSVKTGTVMQASKLPLRKWAIGIYICLTSLKSVSSMKLRRDLQIGQKAAWFMLHRIREAWSVEIDDDDFQGPVEADETYFGDKRKNMSNEKRRELKDIGRGGIGSGKTAVADLKDRESNQVVAKVVQSTDVATRRGFIVEHTEAFATVYTDDSSSYASLPIDHDSVKHSVSEYVKGQAHTNGIESFCSMLKRAQQGTFHKMSPKHLNRYVQEFASKHNMRESDTLAQMRDTVARMIGRRLRYRDLIADNGLCSGARS